MSYRATASLLVLLLCAGLTQAASLAQVQYRLHLDPSADVEADLRALVERGDQPAMLLLADQLARTGQHQDEAIALYQRAFADGHGEIAALAPLAALVERQPDGREAHRAFFAQALQRYPLSRDFATLTTSLDVFLVYPELFPRAEPQALIELYRRACIDACHLNLYRARLAELNGQQALAESLYLQALREDARAVDRLYQALGEQQDTLFPQRVQPLLAEAGLRPHQLPSVVLPGDPPARLTRSAAEPVTGRTMPILMVAPVISVSNGVNLGSTSQHFEVVGVSTQDVLGLHLREQRSQHFVDVRLHLSHRGFLFPL